MRAPLRAIALKPPGQAYAARVAVLDPEGDDLVCSWDARTEIVTPLDNDAGRKETRAPILTELILADGRPEVRLVASRPLASGRLRRNTMHAPHRSSHTLRHPCDASDLTDLSSSARSLQSPSRDP